MSLGAALTDKMERPLKEGDWKKVTCLSGALFGDLHG